MYLNKYNKNILRKFTDCVLSVEYEGSWKKYNVHKILLALEYDFFEKLFDKEDKKEYELHIPFELHIFDDLIDTIYGTEMEAEAEGESKIKKDLNYYENKLYSLFYFGSSNDDIHKFLIDMFFYLDDCYFQKDNSEMEGMRRFIQNLSTYDIIDKENRLNIINRLSYESLTKNEYDEETKTLRMRGHMYHDLPDLKIIVDNIEFDTYCTNSRYDSNEYGFWIHYKKLGETNIKSTTGRLYIYAANKVLQHHIRSYTKFNKKMNFDEKDTSRHEENEGRYGYICSSGSVNQMENNFYMIELKLEMRD